MKTERDRIDSGEEDVRELRLEGAGLGVAAAVLVVALGGAFVLGRWSVTPGPGDGGPPPPVPIGADEPVRSGTFSAEEGATHFDRVEEGQVPEPEREARASDRSATPEARARAARSKSADDTPDGPFVVQVFAGRARENAESVVSDLSKRGYPVRMETEPDGSGTLYRVRVGGFDTREAADEAKDRLHGDGFSAAFVKRTDATDS